MKRLLIIFLCAIFAFSCASVPKRSYFADSNPKVIACEAKVLQNIIAPSFPLFNEHLANISFLQGIDDTERKAIKELASVMKDLYIIIKLSPQDVTPEQWEAFALKYYAIYWDPFSVERQYVKAGVNNLKIKGVDDYLEQVTKKIRNITSYWFKAQSIIGAGG